VENRNEIVNNKPAQTSNIQLQKSRVAFIHFKNMLSNPDVTQRTRKQIYERAKEIMENTDPNARQNLIDMFLEIRDLA
jgi:hypothetical protein